MIPARAYHGKNVAVFGLSRTGLSAARALAAGGAHVCAWDDVENARDKAAGFGDGHIRLASPDEMVWRNISALVLSPGIPLTHPAPHPVVQLAQAAGCDVIGDIDLFARARRADFPAAKLVLVTGTNGKSTTTALIGHILSDAGRQAQVGGNIGTAVLDLEPVDGGDSVYVIEVSSYQLDLTRDPQASVAVLLNITPDHLDRHGGMAGYVAAKRRVFDGLSQQGAAIVGIDDAHGLEISRSLCEHGNRVIPISVESEPAGGVFVRDGTLFDAMAADPRAVMSLRDLPCLPGVHNWQNAAAAFASARVLGIPESSVAAGLRSFPGLAHRMEMIRQIGPVSFVNDSKATNAEAAARALACYGQSYVILGGVPKAGGIEPLAPLFPRIRKAYLIGEAAGAFSQTLGNAVPHEVCGELSLAVLAAYRDAQEAGGEAVILLSPACASFDQFENFEVRGDAFRQVVRELETAQSAGSVS